MQMTSSHPKGTKMKTFEVKNTIMFRVKKSFTVSAQSVENAILAYYQLRLELGAIEQSDFEGIASDPFAYLENVHVQSALSERMTIEGIYVDHRNGKVEIVVREVVELFYPHTWTYDDSQRMAWENLRGALFNVEDFENVLDCINHWATYAYNMIAQKDTQLAQDTFDAIYALSRLNRLISIETPEYPAFCGPILSPSAVW